MSPLHARPGWSSVVTSVMHPTGVGFGTGPGRHWLADRFRHPYLRDALLDRSVIVLSLAIAFLLSQLVPAWQQVALVRTGSRFGETDPFFQSDLSFYVAWLPLESAAYQWTLALLISVSAVVIALGSVEQ